MIKPGWKRELCPQCRQPGRVGERIQSAIRARKPDGKSLFIDQTRTRFNVYELIAPDLDLRVRADFCDNCGVFYAYEALPLHGSNPERLTKSDTVGPIHSTVSIKTEIAQSDAVISDDDEPVDPPPGIRWLTSGTLTDRRGTGILHCGSCFVPEGSIHRERCKIWPTHTTVPTGTQRQPAEREG